MHAMRPHIDDARDERALWQLPDWDAYSESCVSERSSQALNASALNASALDSSRLSDAVDDSLLSWTGDDVDDGSDGDDSDNNVLARRMPQRSPVSTRTSPSTPKRQSALQQLHLRYAQQRQAHELRVVGATRLHTRSAQSDPMRATTQPLAVQSGAANESLSKRDTAKATHTTAHRPAAIQTDNDAAIPPAPAPCPRPTAPKTTTLSSTVTRPRASVHSSIQTDALDGPDTAVAQWVRLLSQRVELLAANYAHERPALSDIAVTSPEQQQQEDGDTVATAWRVGHALLSQQKQQHLTSLTTASFERLEQALAALNAAVDTSTQRMRVRYEQSLATLQRAHHATLERVVAESVDELKVVRLSHRSKLEQLEQAVCAARSARDEWQQRAVEAEHRRALERETTESHAATFRDKVRLLSRATRVNAVGIACD